MNPRLLAAVAAACLLLPPIPARSQATTAPTRGVSTAVLVDQSLAELHYLQMDLNVPYVRASDLPATQYANSGAGIIGGALGSAIGTAIINLEAERSAQRMADAQLTPLTRKFGKAGLQGMIRESLAAALPAHGMEQTTLAFTGGAKLDPRHFQRMPDARRAKRFLLVGYGEPAKAVLLMPLALHDSKRQLRLAIDVELREGSADRNRRVFKRDVVYYGDPVAVAQYGDPLDVLAADDLALLRQEVSRAVAAALAMAHHERKFPDVPKGEEVGVVSEVGLTEFEGVLLEEGEGRALLWTRGDSYVSLPVTQVVRGEQLVAAREVEMARRRAPIPVDPDAPPPELGPGVAPDAPPAIAPDAAPDAAPQIAPDAEPEA